MVGIVKVNSKSEYFLNKDLLIDDFKKILDSDDPKEVAENFNDFFLRLPCFVGYRCKLLEKGETI